ncbi:hypothetical protein TEA_013867 [Camellia sinensis var. sinensis]|uniref:Phosphatidic acid phosphatase type 2/haloperoxidase domain-containing protein n=1 Tax=Camellia sinensis var. sinensis TaxID=542762 RepID=A0A4S4DXJ8_CAMSN|nr:hypothetical protein TEA_013867 [Camellia sinensis var. sinensis]
MVEKMAVTHCGSHTIRSHGAKLARAHMQDWLILLLLGLIIGILNYIEPFHRFIGSEMMTDLKYPFKPDTVPMWAVPIYAILFPCVIFLVYYISRRDVYDLHHAVLGILFSALITGVITESIKDAVGRPRPNFFWRCFKDGLPVCPRFQYFVFNPSTLDVMCTNKNLEVIKEGYKSFPSGHTSSDIWGVSYIMSNVQYMYSNCVLNVFGPQRHVEKIIASNPASSSPLSSNYEVDENLEK